MPLAKPLTDKGSDAPKDNRAFLFLTRNRNRKRIKKKKTGEYRGDPLLCPSQSALQPSRAGSGR